jgi:hypothetical protein
MTGLRPLAGTATLPILPASFTNLMLGVAALCLVYIPASVLAEPTQRDLQVVVRSLGFLDPAPKGTVELGVVYGNDVGKGRDIAERLIRTVDQPIRLGGLTVTLRAVSLEQLASPSLQVLFLTDDSEEFARDLSDRMRGRKILTAALSPSLVSAGLVVMAVQAEPRVRIVVSRVAEQKAGIRFLPAFRMMIQEQ